MGFFFAPGRVCPVAKNAMSTVYIASELAELYSGKRYFWWLPERDFEASFGSSSTTEVAIDMGFFAPGRVCQHAKNGM